ncbi:LOW QUALITY PROTEIN: neuropeptide Y receptor Y8a, partial [Menidia menidia]
PLFQVTGFVQCVSVTVSVFSLVLIALERHQLILHPTGWTPGAGHCYLAVGLTWLLAGLLSLPLLCFSTLTDEPFHNLSLPLNPFRDHLVCVELWPSEGRRLAYSGSLLLVQYLLPLTLVFLCYLRIFLRLRRRRDMLERSRRTRGAQRINALLLAIVVAFAVCWLPLNVFNALLDWHHQALPACQHDAVFSACHLAAMASTCINPVVYGFLNSNFQRELLSTLQRCRRRGPPPPPSYQSFPLSTVASEGLTKASSLHRPGSGGGGGGGGGGPASSSSPRPSPSTRALPTDV